MSISNFFGKSSTAKITQGINLVALAAALIAIAQDPEKAAEFGLDGVVHGITVYALRNETTLEATIGASALNILRIGALYAGLTGDCSSAPRSALVIDTVFHLWNFFYSLILDTKNQEDQPQTSAVTPN